MELRHQLTPHLTKLRLSGMLQTLEARDRQAVDGHWSYIEFLARLLEDEVERRSQKQLALRLRRATVNGTKTLETFDFAFNPTINRQQVLQLGSCDFVRQKRNVLICGPTGVGKTFLACALANQACRQGRSVLYVRLPRLLPALAIGRGDGSYANSLTQLARTDVLVIDDWGLAPLTDEGRRDLLEIFDDRHGARSTIITSQLEVKHWHASMGDPTLADAILDRIVHQAHTLDLDGESLRKNEKPE